MDDLNPDERQEAHTPYVPKKLQALTGRDGWPQGDIDFRPRLFQVKVQDMLETFDMPNFLRHAADILLGNVQTSRVNRMKVGQELNGVIDRLVEFQYVYDHSIPRDHEYSPDENPQRTGQGMLLDIVVKLEGLPVVAEKLVDRQEPFKLQELMPSAHEDDFVMRVQRLKFVFLSVDRVNVTCILFTKRIGGHHDSEPG